VKVVFQGLDASCLNFNSSIALRYFLNEKSEIFDIHIKLLQCAADGILNLIKSSPLFIYKIIIPECAKKLQRYPFCLKYIFY